MWRLSAGVLLGTSLVCGLNVLLLLFTPVQGIPLEGAGPGAVYVVLSVLALLGWAVGAFGVTVLTCRIAGRLEGLVSIAVLVLGTTFLVGFPPAFLDNITAAYLQFGSTIMSLPLLFIFYAGGLVAFFARRPDMI